MVGLNPTISVINYFLSFFLSSCLCSFLPISLPLSITLSFPPLSLPLFCFLSFFYSHLIALFPSSSQPSFSPKYPLTKHGLAVCVLGVEMWWISSCICLSSPSEWLVCLRKDQASVGHHISPLFQAPDSTWNEDIIEVKMNTVKNRISVYAALVLLILRSLLFFL